MLGYVSGAYDILRAKDLQTLDEIIQQNKEIGNQYFAVAIYEDELCERLGLNTPLKSLEDRLNIMKEISGVDFTFAISSLDKKVIQKNAQEAFKLYKEAMKVKNKSVTKKYNVSYVPGTFDLFHAGHLENLLEASKLSKKIVVGVKSDELVRLHKGDFPKINAEERMEILRHFKFVDNVYQYYTRDPHNAIDWIEVKMGEKPSAIFLGSDLKNDFKSYEDLNIIYTDRDPVKMEERSTTGYKRKLKLRNISIEDEKYVGNIDRSKIKNEKLGNITLTHKENDDIEK